MADYKQITSSVDSSLDSFDLQALKAQKRIMEQVQLLVKDIEVDSHGFIKTTISNLQKIAKIKAAISKAVVDDQYKDAVTKLCSQFEEVYKKQMAFYKSSFEEGTIGETAAKKQKLLRQLSVQNTIEGLTGSGINAQITDKLSDMLQRSVTSGARWTDMVSEMKAYLDPDGDGTGAFAKYAKTYATTAMGQFTGQNNKLMTDALDTEWYMYVGSDIETTREFCQHLTKKRYIHVSEIPTILSGDIDGHQCAIYKKTNLPQGMIEGTTPENFQVNVGGWNCRHQLIPVAEEAVPADILSKFDSHKKAQIQKQKEEEDKKLYADYYRFMEENKDWIEESMRKAKVIGREQELLNLINGQKDLSYNKYVNAFDRLDVQISREYDQYKAVYNGDLKAFYKLFYESTLLKSKDLSKRIKASYDSFIRYVDIDSKSQLNREMDRIKMLYLQYEKDLADEKAKESVQQSKSITHISPASGSFVKADDIARYLNDIYQQAGWFQNGSNGVSVDYERKGGCNGSTDMYGRIWLTKERMGWCISAFDKIAKGDSDSITYEEADGMATLWHEITHNRHSSSTAHDGGNPGGTKSTSFMELANEYVARKTLPEFYEAIGAKKNPQPIFETERKSTGYNRMVCKFDRLVREFGGFDEGVVLSKVKEGLFSGDYSKQKGYLAQALFEGGLKNATYAKNGKRKSISITEVKRIVAMCEDCWLRDYDVMLQRIYEVFPDLKITR